ncbi:MAG: nitroreductase family protein [Coriobacteriia bacterium]|nr:nitroreductase family protein [Coriobacteriia bacterium]
MMISQQQSWHEAIGVRHARRSFDATSLPTDELDALEACCREFRPFGDLARTVLVREAPQRLFMGVAGSYGGISGAPSALAFVGIKGAPHVQAAVGYTGEGLVLEATARGLDTCWVGGMFNARHAALLGGIGERERVYAVSPLGHAAAGITTKEQVVFRMGRPKFRRALDEIAPGNGAWPAWARAGVEAAQVAPSALNRQPWRFRLDAGAVIVSAEGVDTPRVSKRLDCGIAMLHFELGARSAGADGTWEFLDGRDAARWVPAG